MQVSPLPPPRWQPITYTLFWSISILVLTENKKKDKKPQRPVPPQLQGGFVLSPRKDLQPMVKERCKEMEKCGDEDGDIKEIQNENYEHDVLIRLVYRILIH